MSLLWKAEGALYYESSVRSVEDPSGSPEERVRDEIRRMLRLYFEEAGTQCVRNL